MVNRLKMDFYRLRKSPLLYILIGATILFSIYMMGTFAFLDFSVKNLGEDFLDAETMGAVAAILPSDFKSFIQIFFLGNFFIVFLIIFAVVFSSAEYKTGYIKNTAAHTSPKYISYFSNLIIITIFATVLFLITGIIVSVGCLLIGEIDYKNKSFHDVLKYIGELLPFIVTKFLSNISLTAFFLMIFYLLRSATPVMISGLTYSMLGTLLFSLVNVVINIAFKNADFDLGEYTNLGNMSTILIGADAGDYIRSAVVSVVFLVISSFVSCYALQKKDIR